MTQESIIQNSKDLIENFLARHEIKGHDAAKVRHVAVKLIQFASKPYKKEQDGDAYMTADAKNEVAEFTRISKDVRFSLAWLFDRITADIQNCRRIARLYGGAELCGFFHV